MLLLSRKRPFFYCSILYRGLDYSSAATWAKIWNTYLPTLIWSPSKQFGFPCFFFYFYWLSSPSQLQYFSQPLFSFCWTTAVSCTPPCWGHFQPTQGPFPTCFHGLQPSCGCFQPHLGCCAYQWGHRTLNSWFTFGVCSTFLRSYVLQCDNSTN
jgi:hypothetical protein